MTDLNQVFLVGRVVRDAELKYTNSGTAQSRFSIAVNRSVKKGDQWAEEVSYFDINLWGKQAEGLNKFLVKGKQIAVQGELRQNRWEKDGQTQSRVEIQVLNIQLLGGAGQNSGGEPRGSSYPSSRQAPANGGQKESAQSADFDPHTAFEDDIPF